MRVRHVLAHEADRLREIRLRSLASDLDALGWTRAFSGPAHTGSRA